MRSGSHGAKPAAGAVLPAGPISLFQPDKALAKLALFHLDALTLELVSSGSPAAISSARAPRSEEQRQAHRAELADKELDWARPSAYKVRRSTKLPTRPGPKLTGPTHRHKLFGQPDISILALPQP